MRRIESVNRQRMLYFMVDTTLMDFRSFNDTYMRIFGKHVFHFSQGFRSIVARQCSLSVSLSTNHCIFTEQMKTLSQVKNNKKKHFTMMIKMNTSPFAIY